MKSSLQNEDNVIVTSHSDGHIRKFRFDEKAENLSETLVYCFNWMPMTFAVESPSGEHTLSSSKDHYAYIWKTDQTEKVDYHLVGHKDMVTAGVFIEENFVVTSSYDQTVSFWKF